LANIAQSEEDEIRKIVRLDLPIIVGEPLPILYVQMDGTGLPVMNKETEGCKGKADGQPEHTRETKLGCVFTKPHGTKEGYATGNSNSTTYTRAIETAEEFGKSIEEPRGKEGPHGRPGRMDLESGGCKALCRSSISITRGSICGTWFAHYTPMIP
jgi:hypothetical protein